MGPPTKGLSTSSSVRQTMSPVAQLRPALGIALNAFGSALALSERTLVVGAPGYRGLGAVYVFGRRTNGVWVEDGQLLASDGLPGDVFGASVSIYGRTIVIGAPGRSQGQGGAYVFNQQNDGTWSQAQTLVANDGALNDRFGSSVSLDGDTIFVGAPRDDVLGAESGSVYTYQLNANLWTQTQKLQANDGAGDDQFGWAVAIDGDRALVSAVQADAPDLDSGAAYAFDRQMVSGYSRPSCHPKGHPKGRTSVGALLSRATERLLVLD